jgi:hypothetical protein
MAKQQDKELEELERGLEEQEGPEDRERPPQSRPGSSERPSSSPSAGRASGKQPKHHQRQHRRTRQAEEPAARSREWWLKTFNDMAAKGAYGSGKSIEGALPTTGAVLQLRSPVIGDAIEEGSRRDERVFRVAKMVYESQIWVMFIATVGAVVTALAVDLGRVKVVLAEIDPEHVIPNPVVRFMLPAEALPVAVGVERSRHVKRAAAAAAQPNGDVRPPGWYGGPAGPVVPASGMAGQ